MTAGRDLMNALVLVIVARRCTDRMLAAMGLGPATVEQLRRYNPGYRRFETVAPEGMMALVEKAVAGDREAMDLLEAECEQLDNPVNH
jgi:hypothetical protein